jgi:hypothetical protein
MGFFQDPLGWAKDKAKDQLNPRDIALNVATGGMYGLNKFAAQGAIDAGKGIAKGAEQLTQGAAPVANAGVDVSQADEARRQQQAFITALQGQMAGNGPSVAQNQLRQATDANIRQAMAVGQSQHGVGYQAALRGIGQNQAQAQQQHALQSAMLRSQEQQQATNSLGNFLGGVRQQDLGQSQLQAGNTLDYAKLNSSIDEGAADRRTKLVGSVLNAGGAAVGKAFGAAHGGPIPGRAAAPGDNPRNDTVPAMLSPGEIVIPRSVAQSEDAPDRAKAFVDAIKKKNGKGQDHGALLERIARLESFAFGGCVK